MSPRPRKASDEEVFAAAARVMGRVGPAQLRLADIAAEAGLTAGALVQRFGSKRGLLLALMETFADATGATFAELRARNPSPLAAVRAYARHFARMGESPDSLAQNLAYLQNDLTDPDFHVHTLRQARETQAALRALLAEAVAAGELARDADPDALARGVQVVVSGSLMAWGIFREGKATRWVRDDLELLLRPYLAAPA